MKRRLEGFYWMSYATSSVSIRYWALREPFAAAPPLLVENYIYYCTILNLAQALPNIGLVLFLLLAIAINK